MNAVATARLSAEERREAVLAAALSAFAAGGLHGTSTEEIASRAGISQPYLFRLFGTKKALFLAVVERCMDDTLDGFRRSSEGLHGAEALERMGEAYIAMVLSDRDRLLCQMQAYAACGDPDVRQVMRTSYRRLFEFVEARSGAPVEEVSNWFACGKLLNVVACMDLWAHPEPWSHRMLVGCIGDSAEKKLGIGLAGS
ncbi:MAG: TetR/AcrR family transcriptional regulator [Actinobacteria bacterium]|nr:TetR/AcrR family transcriptional regulator [Actinomycetota bacterium]